MARLEIPTRDNALQECKAELDAIYASLGMLPALFRLIGSSPAALTAYSAFQAKVSETLDTKLCQRIALAVAQVNGSDYCLSAHNYLAINVARLSPEEIACNRRGSSLNPKASPAVAFAAEVAEERGRVSDAALAAVRQAGFSDAEVIEIVALVAACSFTNYLDAVAQMTVDFPLVEAGPGGGGRCD